jgi:hypothetical protein
MKIHAIPSIALISFALLPAFQKANAATQSVDGVISDSMCGKTHMMPGKPDAKCVEECAKAGSSYVLVAGNKIYTLAGKPQTIAPFAGKHVHIVGDLNKNVLTIASIHN